VRLALNISEFFLISRRHPPEPILGWQLSQRVIPTPPMGWFMRKLIWVSALAIVGLGCGDSVGGVSVLTVRSSPVGECQPGTASEYEVVVSASGSDLTYRGSVSGCTGSLDAATSIVDCPNAAAYSGTVIVTDGGGAESDFEFEVNVCEITVCEEIEGSSVCGAAVPVRAAAIDA